MHKKRGDAGVICHINPKPILKKVEEFGCKGGALKGGYLEVKPTSATQANKFFICELVVLGEEGEYNLWILTTVAAS